MEHYKVYDKNGKLLVSDIVIRKKTDVGELIFNNNEKKIDKALNIELISFDTKYFLNKTYFKFELVNDNIKDVENYKYDRIKFDINNFKGYRVVKWHDVTIDHDAPIYRDYGYDELDPEVVDLVHALNSIPSIMTTGSCSGHGSLRLFVTMNILDYDTILLLTNIINTYFYKDFRLTTDEIVYQKNFNNVVFIGLVSTAVGEEAYQKAKELAKVIEANKDNIYIKLVNQRTSYDGLRVQVFELDGNMVVDDVAIRTRRFACDRNYTCGYINKRLVVNKCYISFDTKYYFNIDTRLFRFNVLNHISSPELYNFDRIKFDINNFKRYQIEDLSVASGSDAPIFINNEPDHEDEKHNSTN